MAKSKKKSKSQTQNVAAQEKKPTGTISTVSKPSVFKFSPIYDLLHYFEKAQDQWEARYVLVMTAILYRAAVGLGGYSGEGVAPMFGDFEAQRHWMELTIHLPISQWYIFDLQYWGLDYPPLTAFHSYICGQIGNFINPEWFALNASRGIENSHIKNFMRYSSLVSELFLYIPAVLAIANLLGKKFKLNRMDQIVIACLIINQPHLILIDHGHFQYNSVMLGFFVYSVIELIKGRLTLASIWFVCCINFKQMGLYYSTFIFVFILSQLKSFQQLVSVGFTVLLTQFVILIPFLQSPSNLLQILIRVFPFNRGLFEDKVANFWCTSNVIVKYREIIDMQQLSKLSLITTILSILPMNIILFMKLRKTKDFIPGLIYGFIGNSFSFYLFSYQVHEKSILIPLVPSVLLIFVDAELIDIIQWINNVGTFSLYPLLKKDELVLQYVIGIFIINWLIGSRLLLKSRSIMWNMIIKGCYLAMATYHVIDFWFEPPSRYPDLWVILNCAISFAGFALFWLWVNIRIWKLKVE